MAVALCGLLLTGCGDGPAGRTDPAQVDAVALPQLGACRALTPADVAEPSNATRTVACATTHTAETFAVGRLPAALTDVAYDSARLDVFAYRTCSQRFAAFLDADDSEAMRTIVAWAWFRPSQVAWDHGARWYRCDAVGGAADNTAYARLPTTVRGLLAGKQPADRWMACVDGPSVHGAVRIPCTSAHTWRAVTAIRVGDPADAYPGDAKVETTSRTYCSDYVGAWLGYPDDYDFGYTWFHQPEWQAGNRRSVCWARTTA